MKKINGLKYICKKFLQELGLLSPEKRRWGIEFFDYVKERYTSMKIHDSLLNKKKCRLQNLWLDGPTFGLCQNIYRKKYMQTKHEQ